MWKQILRSLKKKYGLLWTSFSFKDKSKNILTNLKDPETNFSLITQYKPNRDDINKPTYKLGSLAAK